MSIVTRIIIACYDFGLSMTYTKFQYQFCQLNPIPSCRAELVKACVKENVTSAQSQEEYAKESNGLLARYEKATARLGELTAEKERKRNQDREIRLFIKELLREMSEAKEDDYDVVLPDEPKSHPGDIYQLGRHRLMCGDSTIKENVEKLMGGKKADLLITDPPYNINYQGGTKDKLKIQNDSMADDAFRKFLVSASSAADSVMK